MFPLALRMARRRVAALIAVASAALGGAALATGLGVLAETGLRSQAPLGRLAGADVIVSADQTARVAGDLPQTLPERARVPADLVNRIAVLPGVAAAAGEVSFPAAVVDAHGRVVTAGNPRTAGHNWSAAALLGSSRIAGEAPVADDEIALDQGVAKAASVRPGDRVTVAAVGRPATYRVTALVGDADGGVYFADSTASRLVALSVGPAVGTTGAATGNAKAGTATGGTGRAQLETGQSAVERSDVDGSEKARSASGHSGVGNSAAGWPEPGRSGANVSETVRAGMGEADAGRSGALAAAAVAKVDLIAVRAEPGAAEKVAAEIRGLVAGQRLVVSVGDERGDAAAPETAAARQILPLLAASMAGTILLIIGFIIGGALSVSIAARRRELALMRAIGATPKQIRRLAAAEATVVALLASAVGVPLGYLLVEWLRRLLVASGVVPESLPLVIGPLPALAAVLLVVLVVQVAARTAAWRISHLPATEAVAESRVEPRTPPKGRAFAGLLLLLAANLVAIAPLFAQSIEGAAATSLAGILAAIGLAFAGPTAVNAVSRWLARRLPANVSAPTWLAVANTHGYALRVAGAVATLAMAVVFTLTYAFTQTTLLGAADQAARDAARAQLSVAAPALGGLPADAVERVRRTPGVRDAAPVTGTTVLWSSTVFGQQSVEATGALVLTPRADAVLDLKVREGGLADLTGNTVAVDASAAAASGLRVGDSVKLTLGDGTPVTPKIVAVYERGAAIGPVVLSADLAAGHTTTSLHQSVLVAADDPAVARANLAGLAAEYPGLTVIGEAEGGALPGAGVPPELWINVAVLAVLLGYVLLGIANRLIASTGRRGGELALLRLIGATPAQVRAMMRREALLITVAALAGGLLLSAVPLALLSIGFLGRPWPAGPVWLAPAVVAVVAVLAFVAIELPTRRAVRLSPSKALAQL